MRTRLGAWLYTGPLGHLAAGVADWIALIATAIGRSRRPCQPPDKDAQGS
jgi:hypothetical protein